jgi:hypothetical protein
MLYSLCACVATRAATKRSLLQVGLTMCGCCRRHLCSLMQTTWEPIWVVNMPQDQNITVVTAVMVTANLTTTTAPTATLLSAYNVNSSAYYHLYDLPMYKTYLNP